MRISDFDYNLPEELIAQKPAERRDSSRLLVVHRDTGKLEHKHFFDIIDYLKKGDCLVLNNSKVLPARLYGVKEKTGAKVEFLLIKRIEGDTWAVSYTHLASFRISERFSQAEMRAFRCLASFFSSVSLILSADCIEESFSSSCFLYWISSSMDFPCLFFSLLIVSKRDIHISSSFGEKTVLSRQSLIEEEISSKS